QLLQSKTRPAVEDAIRAAEKSYQEGGASLVLVLETTRQLLDTRARDVLLQADARRAWAELERGVGRRLDVSPAPACAPTFPPHPTQWQGGVLPPSPKGCAP